MGNRDDMRMVIEGLQRDHALQAAFLEATDEIDWRALHRRVAIGKTSDTPIQPCREIQDSIRDSVKPQREGVHRALTQDRSVFA